MNSRAIRIGLWLAALAALLLGVGLTVQSMGLIAAADGRMRDRLSEFDELLIVEADLAYSLAAERTFAALDSPGPGGLETMIEKHLPGHTAADVRDSGGPAPAGWIHHRKEVTFNEAPLADVMKLVSALEAARPPWRLVKCVIRSSSRTAGAGRVTLTLDAMERAD